MNLLGTLSTLNKPHWAKRLAVGAALMLMAACTPPPELTTQGMRPGISSGADYDKARLRGGLSAGYRAVLAKGAPIDMTMSLRTSNGSKGNINFSDELRLTIPNGSTEKVAQGLLPTDLDYPFEIKGDSIIFKGSGVMDRKGRTLMSRTRLAQGTNTPHDCWAVLGMCKSSIKISNGQEFHIIIDTTERDGFWYTSTRLDPAKMKGSNKLVEKSVYSIDRNLLFIDMKWISFEERPYTPFLIRRTR